MELKCEAIKSKGGNHLNEEVYRKVKINLLLMIFLIGLILFVIGIGWYVKNNNEYYLDIETESSNFERTFLPGFYIFGILFITYGIVSYLVTYTSKLVPLKSKILYQLIITIGFLFAVIFEIISKIIQYYAYENIMSDDFIDQLYMANTLRIMADFGLLTMFLIIFIFIFKLYNLNKFRTMVTP